MSGPFSVRTEHLDVHYGTFHAVKNVSIEFRERRLTSLIGPSGCGKSSLLRVFNRMNDAIPGCRIEGTVEVDGQPVYAPDADVYALRRRVGMVFQRPNPFPLSIYDNVTYGPRIHAMASGVALEQLAERYLEAVGLWQELRERLDESALSLAPEQMQRLCIARALAVEPTVLLMDEPCSALDPVATMRVEALMRTLAQRYTVIVVTHNMQQAARISDETGFMLLGELVEMGSTAALFTQPRDKRTEDYVTGRYG
ncbi:MAG TPA: phosphate ABC transporter ATP-binding protein PstB [Polyangiaceae bacterium]|nr:phosphate ABC transporter ATP-binding protein PstB [Polyangiaceae bacterium]